LKTPHFQLDKAPPQMIHIIFSYLPYCELLNLLAIKTKQNYKNLWSYGLKY
jgi:hypothetical protein